MRICVSLQQITLTILTGIFLGCLAESLKAFQSQATAQIYRTTLSEAQQQFYKAEIEKKISVEFEDDTLEEALHHVAREAGLRLTYRGDIMVDKKVSLREKEVSVSDVLRNILDGTGLDYRFSQNGYLLVTEAEDLFEEYVYQETVTGRVTDAETGELLPGVNVVVDGTTIGTSTNVEGNFELSVPSLQETLIFTFIGYQRLEVPINGRVAIDVALQSQTIAGEEIVVIGYGTARRQDVTGSVSSISERHLADVPMTNVSEALKGKIPGLDVVSSGVLPGDPDQILLRGRRSFVASNDPLVILDGAPFYGALNDINPYDIQSVDVLKDASATSIYGAQGANGVLIITTKRGNIGSPKFSYEGHFGTRSLYGNLPVQNVQQFVERKREAARAAGNYPDSEANNALDQRILRPVEYEVWSAGEGSDYQELLYDHLNMYQHKHQLSVMGGSESIRYNLTGNFFNEEGIIPSRQFDRYSLRVNLDYTLSPKVTFGSSILVSYTERNSRMHPSSLSEALVVSPLGKDFAEDGTPRFDPADDGFRRNPLSDLLFDSYRWSDKRRNTHINLFAVADIIPDLTYRLNFNSTVNMSAEKESAGQFSMLTRGELPMATIGNIEINRNTYEGILTYDKFLTNDHHITATAVHSLQTSKTEHNGSSVTGLSYEPSRYHNIGNASDINFVSSDLQETTLLSFAGRLFYGFKSKYLLSMSLRADGASQFSSRNKWGYFPSVGLAWNVTEETFLNRNEWLSNLKLRFSYGVTGNQGINPYQTQGGLTRTIYAFGESPGYGMRPVELANQSLKWESTEVYNIGLDFGIFNNRINGNLELYTTNTNDLLLFRQLPVTTGFDRVLENVGRTKNKGLELGLNTRNVQNSNFQWTTDLSFYLNREEIVELYAGTEDDIGNGWFIGYPINVYYDFNKIGIWQLDEAEEAASYGAEPGQIKFEDLNNDGSITDADRKILGTTEPDFVFNISNSFAYKNWDLKLDAYVRWGNMIQVGGFVPAPSGRLNYLVFDYWTPDNPTNAYPRPDDRALNLLHGQTLAYRDGSFIRLRQLSVGYRVPNSFLDSMNISNMRLFFTVDNPWYWTRSEMDDYNIEPEWSGRSTGFYPATRNFVLGVNINF